ncbi:AdoMet-dependent rRNA methyltransferase spb1 [Thecamonas trahens ATCC 50062]|uniref:Putative rRNA methyltransferase n=1 Tax=Thecamonas trahens ATCC 50062 TaxID=461836 RepID=A0A0L0DC61_THETB|nr:AdoMet-dependent rRNA methyltransferase spb1 [Thecamonas trahens ATCC 50062]KNC49934.1 AdoMet-dependent rRNA methyltransferase spb1 [Thecamonas trahens ATCC 50062]|eukprot:XP_013757412.1 AdoMet-dependent rRNA methyltransferase spb1 [Thecamonas trahens ATCC 50062]
MPSKKQKKGKGRLDKYYHLAKEQGYRSRAAYKLIQLNKKYEFLSSARVCIDLCAAPGGWLQVATKYMPMSSLVMGIDLDPIQPIKGVTTLVADITTPRCRKEIAGFLKGWKADVFLHDGAPNMGKDWTHDAYSQACLVLESCKLASEFLTRGGTFVTKVFRSKDYNALIWVFQQLFNKVDATKPPSSRGVSAEIFVVCQDFKAPDSIDPRMFEASSIFADVAPNATVPDIFNNKQKRHRTGYADDVGSLLYKEVPLAFFVDSLNPMTVLAENNKLTTTDAESKVYINHPKTTDEILACVADLRVLSKSDFKRVLRWRKSMRAFMGLDAKPETEEVEVTTTDLSLAELANADEDVLAVEMERFKERMRAIEKRKKRKTRSRLAKYRQHLTLAMPAGDVIETPAEASLFSLETMPTQTDVNAIIGDSDAALAAVDDEEVADVYLPKGVRNDTEAPPGATEPLEGLDYDTQVEADLEAYHADKVEREQRATPRVRVGKKIKRVRQLGISTELYMDLKAREMGLTEEAEAIAALRPNVDRNILSSSDDDDSSNDDADDDADESSDDDSSESSDAKFFAELQKRRAAAAAVAADANTLITGRSGLANPNDVFSSDLFQGLEVDDDADKVVAEMRGVPPAAAPLGRSGERAPVATAASAAAEPSRKRKREPERHDPRRIVLGSSGDDSSSDEPESESDGVTEFEVVPQDPMSFSDSDDKAEYLALAKEMAARKRRESLIDKSYNRRAHNEDNLPSWYEDYLAENNQPSLPITKEMVAELKHLHKAVNARPIKRVAEAKARKKMRAVIKLEKMKRQVTAIANDTDLSATSRARMIERLYRAGNKAVDKPKRRLVIGKRAEARGGKSVTRSYRMVDRRLKADLGRRTSKKVRTKRARHRRR